MPSKATKKKVSKKPVAKRAASKKTAAKTKAKKQYSKAERTLLIVTYSAFASVFVLFATDSDSGNIWYCLLALACLAMVLRHTAGILKTYGSK